MAPKASDWRAIAETLLEGLRHRLNDALRPQASTDGEPPELTRRSSFAGSPVLPTVFEWVRDDFIPRQRSQLLRTRFLPPEPWVAALVRRVEDDSACIIADTLDRYQAWLDSDAPDNSPTRPLPPEWTESTQSTDLVSLVEALEAELEALGGRQDDRDDEAAHLSIEGYIERVLLPRIRSHSADKRHAHELVRGLDGICQELSIFQRGRQLEGLLRTLARAVDAALPEAVPPRPKCFGVVEFSASAVARAVQEACEARRLSAKVRGNARGSAPTSVILESHWDGIAADATRSLLRRLPFARVHCSLEPLTRNFAFRVGFEFEFEPDHQAEIEARVADAGARLELLDRGAKEARMGLDERPTSEQVRSLLDTGVDV